MPIPDDDGMPRPAETSLSFHALHEGTTVRVSDYRCCAPRGDGAAEEHNDGNNIVLMRHGAFCKQFGRRRMVADVNHAVFFARGATYRVSHPADDGDRGTVFVVAPDVLHQIVRELDPSIDDHPDRPFPFVTGPCPAEVFWRHHWLVRRLEVDAASPPEPLWTEEVSLGLVSAVLAAAFARHGSGRKPHREDTDADHADRIEAAKVHLASRLAERVTLAELARAVHTSPYHLARMFRQRTGSPIHRYLNRLRLRAALERLADARDLTGLALELGFSSHSHFTDAFRREFGCPPSRARRDTRHRALPQTSKNLEA